MILVDCYICGKQKSIFPSHKKEKNCCTKKCRVELTRQFMIGKRYRLGKKLSEQHKKKISESHKKIGVGKWMQGRTLSGDIKEKISIAQRGSKSHFWKGGLTLHPKYFSFMEKRRQLRKKNNSGVHTIDQWEELKKKFGYMCLCCKKCEPEIKLTEDHIVPISKGGTDDIENIQPLCPSCNSKKHTKEIKYSIEDLVELSLQN